MPNDDSQYECKKCKDTEFVFYKDLNGYEYAKECECRTLKIANRLLEKSGISEEFQSKTFANFEERGIPQITEAKNKAREYYMSFSQKEENKDKNNSIMFMGQVGSGKTHLATALANNLIKQKNVAVVYMGYRQTATRLKQLITNEYEYTTELNKFKDARVLFIDDMLKGKITEADVNLLYEIVDYRYYNKKPMIITTEKTRKELIEFDEALASRIIEMSKNNIVELQGKELNYRLYD